MRASSYAIALGSNRRHHRHGAPAKVVGAALNSLGELGIVTAASRIIDTPALGPAGRRFANAAALLLTELTPPELLEMLKRLERAFGRRSGRRWGPRVLDLDIVLWTGGAWAGPGLTVPHPEFRNRTFVLQPLDEIAGGWRDPLSGRTVRQLCAIVDRARPRP